MESPNASFEAVELNPSCSGQAHPNRPGTGPGHKSIFTSTFTSILPRSIFTVLCIPFMICPLRSADANPARFSKRFRATGTNGRLDLSLSWQASEDPLKDHTRYDQGLEIHGGPRRVSLLVGEAQLARCLKVWVSGPLEWDAGIQ